MNPVYRLFATVDSLAPTVLRLVLAGVFAIHGGQKTVGWLGGEGWTATLQQWTGPDGLHLPYPLAALRILAEALGALGMLTGFLTRLAALGIFCAMSLAMLTVHWRGDVLTSEGYEYPLTLAGVALALMLCGGGRWSLDRLVTRVLLPPNSGLAGGYRLPLL